MRSKCLTPVLALLPFAALGQEVEVPPNPAAGVELTIYESNLALIKDRRDITLPGESADLAFAGVSGQMQPESALLRVLSGAPLDVAEQTFDFDVITREALLKRSVGQEVSVVTVNPASGREVSERAKVISVDGGLVLDIGGRIHTETPGRIVFDRLPPDLRATPTLVLSVTGKSKANSDVELSYLSGGIGWHADYVAAYDADVGQLDLTAWASVTNTSGTDFKAAKLKLVSGEVNRTAPPRPNVKFRAMEMAAAAAPMADGVAQQDFAAYHLYDFAPLVDLAANQTKQLALMSATAIKAKQEYVVQGQPNFYYGQMQNLAPVNADSVVTFKNDAAAKLGLPLPAGIVRLYGQDTSGAPQFMGEDRIGHIPEGGDVRLTMGRDFDITADRQQMSFVRPADNMSLSVWKVVLKNAKDKAVTVRLIEPIQGDWEIMKESHPHTKTNAGTAEWAIDVPAKGETTVEYNVRTRF